MKTKALNCSNCGAALTIRGLGRGITAVCGACLSVLDLQSPELQVLHRYAERQRVEPVIPLGRRGKWRGTLFENIGFQVRTCEVDGIAYSWHEYLLFNPYKGFRYLTMYAGHWNIVVPAWGLPVEVSIGGKPGVTYLGKPYRHFQSVSARTDFVLGEFPWRVQAGEVVFNSDYINPPYMLSAERTGQEITWSQSEYVQPGEVWQAFALQGQPMQPQGVFANQPSNASAGVGAAWLKFLGLILVLAVMMFASSMFMSQERVFNGNFQYEPGKAEAAAVVTPEFDLKGRTTNVEIEVETPDSRRWVYFHMALINQQSGEAWDFGRQVGDEGSRRDRAVLPSVPAGRYYLRIEPETEKSEFAVAESSIPYEIKVRRDVPVNIWFVIAALMLIIPPIFKSLQAASFEGKRWAESDYGGGGGGDE